MEMSGAMTFFYFAKNEQGSLFCAELRFGDFHPLRLLIQKSPEACINSEEASVNAI